jgi:hypothetical protein
MRSKFKNKNTPFILVGGVVFLTAFLIIIPLIGVKTTEFDSRFEKEIDNINAQIVEEKYREVYLNGSRRLITSYSEREFVDLVKQIRPYINGKVEKSCHTEYKDMFNRLKRNLFSSFETETYCQVETKTVDSETVNSRQSFGFKTSGSEIKLNWIEFKR